MKRLTLKEIEAGKTEAGGWTRETLEAWGLPWPPPKGWKWMLTGKEGRVTDRRDRYVKERRSVSCEGCAFCDVWRPAMPKIGLRDAWQTCANEFSSRHRQIIGSKDRCPEYFEGKFGSISSREWNQQRKGRAEGDGGADL